MEIRTAAMPYSQGMQAWKLTQALLPSTFSDRREKERSCFKETPHFATVDFGHFKVNCKVVDCIFLKEQMLPLVITTKEIMDIINDRTTLK